MTPETAAAHAAACDKNISRLPPNVVPEAMKSEPHRLNWTHKGLDCMIVRNPLGLFLCGYVGVKKDHPLFEVDYNEGEEGKSPEHVIEVHGGLTYSEHCQGPICHASDDADDKTWWFGFDCAHAFDQTPGYYTGHGSFFREFLEGCNEYSAHYRDIEFVKAQVNDLAKQLRDLSQLTHLEID